MSSYSDSPTDRVTELQAENNQLRLHLATLIASAENVTYRTLADFFQAIEAAKDAIAASADS